MTRRQRPTPSVPSDRPLPVVTNVSPGSSTVTQQAHNVLRPVDMHVPLMEQQALQQAQYSNNMECKVQDVQPASTAREVDISISSLDTQGAKQAPSGQAKVNSDDSSSLPDSNLRFNPEVVSIFQDLRSRVRVVEKHLHAEKQLTATLEEALVDIETQSNKSRADGETWKKRAQQLEKELQGLREERALPGGMELPTQQLECRSMSYLQAEQSLNRMELGGASGRGDAPDLAVKACEACRQRHMWCSSIGDAIACMSCVGSNRVCSYMGSPPSKPGTQPNKPCFASLGGTAQTQIVPAAHGHAFEVRAGSRFRIIDLHGEQVVDFMAWCMPYKSFPAEHLSMSYTRHAIGGSAPPQVGQCLYTNKDEPIFRLIADTVKTHDMLYMACNPGFYKRLGREGHRSCATNIAEAMRGYGMQSWMEVTDPFNVFQNTPYYSLKALNCSRAGDYVEFQVLKDAVCAVSSCPFDGDGFNGGRVTEVAVVTGI